MKNRRLLLLIVVVGVAITGAWLIRGSFKTAATPQPMPAAPPMAQPTSQPAARGDLAIAIRLLNAARAANQQTSDPQSRDYVQRTTERLLTLSAALERGQAGDFSPAMSLAAAQSDIAKIDDDPTGRIFCLLAGFDALSGLDQEATRQTDQARHSFLVAHGLVRAGYSDRAIALMSRTAAADLILEAQDPAGFSFGRKGLAIPAEMLLDLLGGDAAIDVAAKTRDPADRTSNLLALASRFFALKQTARARRAVELAAAGAPLMSPTQPVMDGVYGAHPVALWATLAGFQHRLGDTEGTKKSVTSAIAIAKAMPSNSGTMPLLFGAAALGGCDASEEGAPVFDIIAAAEDSAGRLAEAGEYERAVRVVGGDAAKAHVQLGIVEPKTPAAAQRYLKAFGGLPPTDPREPRGLELKMVRAIALAGDAKRALNRAGTDPLLISAAIEGRIVAGDLEGSLKLLKAWPDLSSRIELTTRIAQRMHSQGDSIAAAELMIGLPGSNEFVMMDIAQACQKARRTDLVCKIVAKYPPNITEEIVRMLIEGGHFESAIAAANGAERDSSRLRFLAGCAYARLGKPAEAQSMFEKHNNSPAGDPLEISDSIAGEWARTDPLAAEKWAMGLSSPDARARGLAAAAMGIFRQHDLSESLGKHFRRFNNANPLLR
jgi:hypothetical protein